MNRKLKMSELNRMEVADYKASVKFPVVIVLDNIRSLHNIGSVFRTADAFRVNRVVLCGMTARPPHREIHKTALGATESVDWNYFEEVDTALKQLREEGYKMVSIEQTENAVMLNNFSFEGSEKLAFIFGNEVFGIQQKIIDQSDLVLEIPQFGTKHSFNISVSVGIVLWEIMRKATL